MLSGKSFLVIVLLQSNIENGKARLHNRNTFGQDFNSIAKETMLSFERTPIVATQLIRIQELINEKEYDEAKSKLDALFEILGEKPYLNKLNSIIKRKKIVGR